MVLTAAAALIIAAACLAVLVVRRRVVYARRPDETWARWCAEADRYRRSGIVRRRPS